MKYYMMCKKVLGQKPFDDLVNVLTNQIIEHFSSDILLDKYMEILEYNIRLIMLISIGNLLDMDDKEKEEKISLKNTEDFLCCRDIK